jgi:hypothetical protein
MKFLPTFAIAAFAGLQTISAFPHMALKTNQGHTVRDILAERSLKNGGKLEVRDLIGGLLSPLTGVLAALDLPTPQNQIVEQIPDDAHPYIAPGPNDIRGLCPTMNTMANHGYISRNGITTFAEAANGCQQAYGFGYDLCTFLSGLGLLAGGDLATGKISISGPDSRVPNTLGDAKGLDNHGPFEVS